jgi:ABC-type transporter Mla subunit MlaD
MSAAVGQTGNPIPRRFRRRVSPFRAGGLALLLVAIASYLAFTKQLPWRQPFEFNAVFQTSSNIGVNSPVRIAGVNVGEVTKVGHQKNSDLAVVRMEMKETGLPIHEDATLKIRPRLFLEGNFFVDLKPGTPEQPAIEDGDTVSVTQTATPVQLDEVLLEALPVLLHRHTIHTHGGGLAEPLLGACERGHVDESTQPANALGRIPSRSFRYHQKFR